MIPPFNPFTGYLPAGPHTATWQEIVERFGWNGRRRALLTGLALALRDLQAIGGRTFYLNGSFVTAKEEPGDFDLAYVTFEVTPEALETAYPFLFGQGEATVAARRAYYQGDILPHDPSEFWSWLDYFARDREDVVKGYIILRLSEEPLS